MINLLFLIYGIVIGSFLNVCILRIPMKESITFDRSHCPKCQYQLKWYDLVPVISYIALGGKCRQCKSKISIQYPLIELLNGAAYLGIYLLKGLQWDTVIMCLTFSTMLVIFMIDLRHKIIPNGLVICTLVIGIARVIIYGDVLNHVIGFFAVSLFLILLAFITRKPMGLGDIKLMAAAGLLLGWKEIILALMIGAIVGSIIGLALIVLKVIDRKAMIPFGPFLTTGIMVAMVFGEPIIQLYLDKIITM